MSAPVVMVDELTKRYDDGSLAVDGISFEIQRGRVMGLLGPNGAGKTTTIQMMVGITEMTAGSIRYFDQDFVRNRKMCLQRINYTSTYSEMIERSTVAQNLQVYGYLYSIARPQKKIGMLAEFFGVEMLLTQKFATLSAGQKTRVNLVKAFMNDPELVLMDEPTASLDPDIRDKVMTMIEEMRDSKGLTLLYTSHNMDEVTRICDEVIFLHDGAIVARDTPTRLAARAGTSKVVLSLEGDPKVLIDAMGRCAELSDGKVEVAADSRQIADVIAQAHSIPGIRIVDVEIDRPDLEDAFLRISRANHE